MRPKKGGSGSSSMLVVKTLVLTIFLVVLNGIGSQLLPSGLSDQGLAVDANPASPATASITFILPIMLCQVLALTLPVTRSRWYGLRLTLVIFVVFFGTQTFMNQIESLIYLGGKMPHGFISGLFLMGLFVAAVFSPIAVLVLGRWRKDATLENAGRNRLTIGKCGWRILAAGLVFLCLYYLFGYYIAWQDADLRAYYGGTDPGSFIAQMHSVVSSTPWMVPIQYLRGLLWVGLGLLIMSSMRGPRWHAGLACALLFSVPTLYLLLPNPVMPDFPRMTHFIETLPYQFLFGWFLSIFLVKKKGPIDLRQKTAVHR